MGSREFVERIETQLDHRAADPELQPFRAGIVLRDPEARRYGHVFLFRPKTSL